MNTRMIEQKFNMIAQRLELNQAPFEVEVTELSFSEKESLRNMLRSKGVRAEFYTELRRSFMGVWKN